MGERETSLKQFLESIPELQDPDTLKRIYSHFPNREDPLEKHNWKSKYDFWKRIILESCLVIDKFTFDLNELTERFRYQGLQPLCLETVLIEMEKQRTIQKKDEFDRADEGWSIWIWNTFLVAPLRTFFQQNKVEGIFVLYDHINTAAQSVLRKYKSQVLLMEELEKEHNSANLELILHQLRKMRKAHESEINGKRTIKFSSSQVTPVEKGIIHMKITLQKLRKQVRDMEKDIQMTTLGAIDAKKIQNKAKAVSLMKRRKRLENILSNRYQSVDTIEQILDRIEQSRTDQEIFDAYQLGSRTLEEITTKNGLTVESVDEVMENLSQLMADQREIDEAFKSGNEAISVVDDAELEEELEKLSLENSNEQLIQELNSIHVPPISVEESRETPSKEQVKQLLTS